MPHILIVEDEAAIADTLVYALQADGHSTEWVTLGGAALDQQRQRPADLIILDIGLPDISGFETCRQLRRFSDVPVNRPGGGPGNWCRRLRGQTLQPA